jgi:hypothetical protein
MMITRWVAKYNFVLILSIACHNIACQTLGPVVLAVDGGFVENETIFISYTIGESVTETYINNDVVLTQGFHQVDRTLTSSNSINVDYLIRIYPNPTSGRVYITPYSQDQSLTIRVLNSLGSVVLNDVIVNGQSNIEIDLSAHASGIYIIQTRNLSGTIYNSTHTIIKAK